MNQVPTNLGLRAFLSFHNRSLFALLAISLSLMVPIKANASIPTVLNETSVTAAIKGVGDIWTGKIPTKVAFPPNEYCDALSFSIQGLLPLSVLADRALGVKVEFEIWSELGKKVANDTVFSSSWNPTGPNTLVSIYMPSNCSGKYTMLIRTIYSTNTNGLLSSYLSEEKKLAVEFTGGRSLSNSLAMTKESTLYTAKIDLVGEVWSANLPTSVALADGSYYGYINFQITALKPFSVLANRAAGTSIEFEIWDKEGKKIASDYLFSSDWSPIGTNTLGEIYLGSEVGPGTYSLVTRTIYKTSTDGLLSSYLKAENTSTLVITGSTRPKANQPTIIASNNYTSSISGVGKIWSGSLPKQLQLPDESSSKLEFAIQGLLPIAQLTDRALGVSVEFEVWSERGWKVASDTIYSSDWNTKGPDTLVSIYMFPDRFFEPTILKVKTIYATRTNGLLTSYLKDEVTYPITVLGKSSATEEVVEVDKDVQYVANIKQVGDIWRGSIPSEVSIPKSTYSNAIEFQIEGLLPYSTLASTSLGVKVEFEIWTDQGEKLGYDTVYSSEWNPVWPKTLVDISLPSRGTAGTHTLLIRTIYETDTNGLQSSYIESKTSQKIKITGGNALRDDDHRILESRNLTSSITGVGSIWSGDVPTKVALSSSSYSSGIRWQIQGLLPFSTLADRSTGTDVDFEVWSKSGEKVVYESISYRDWNPVGTKTLAKMNIWSSLKPGSYNMIVKTTYRTRSNGLLSSYLKDEKTFPFEVLESGKISENGYFYDVNLSEKRIPGIFTRFKSNNKVSPITIQSNSPEVCAISGTDLQLLKKGVCILVANQKGAGALYDSTPLTIDFEVKVRPPSDVDTINSLVSADGITYSWTAPESDEKIVKYEIGYSVTKSVDLTPNLNSSYQEFVVKETTTELKATITPEKIYNFMLSNPQSSGVRGFHFRVSVRAVSEAGISDFWDWNYVTAAELNTSFWSKYPASAEVVVTDDSTGPRLSAIQNQTAALRLTGKAQRYSWRFATAPAGSNFAQYSYDPNGKEFASSTFNSISEAEALIALDAYKSTFPANGAVLITAHPMIGASASLEPRGKGVYYLTEALIRNIELAKAAKAKAEAEAKAKAEAESANKKTTITCVKGKLTKKVTAIKPKCPSGYKKK